MKYVLTALAAAAAAFLLAPLLFFRDHPAPAKAHGTSLAERFPAQNAAYQRPAADDPRWKEKRGHAYSIKDRDETAPEDDPRWNRILAGRPKQRPLPARCIACHATVGTVTAGSYYETAPRKALGCPDCHDPNTSVLRLTREAPRAPASYEDLRTLICAQCHRDYEPAPETSVGQLPELRRALGPPPLGRPGRPPQAGGLPHKALAGWKHAETGAAVLKAHHPQFEMYSQGIHARAGAACTDCHMPASREGAVRITDHNARSPLENLQRACLPCHRGTPEEMRARVDAIQQRTAALLSRGEDALVAAIDAIEAAQAAGARVDAALKLQTKAQWRLDFVAADRSKGFHAPQEAARLLAEAIDYARQAQLEAARAARSAISHQASAIRHQPSAISRQPSAVSRQPSAVSRQP